MNLKPSFVQIDGGAAFACFTSGQTWNGWACPSFTLEVAHLVAAEFDTVKFDAAEGVFFEVVEGCEPDEPPIRYAPRTVDIDGVPTTLYAIGSHAWVWDEVDVERLADAFSRALRDALEDDQMAAAVERNRTAEPGVCHSHDYCDANMVMLAAFEEVMGRQPLFLAREEESPATECDMVFWGKAWDAARAAGFLPVGA